MSELFILGSDLRQGIRLAAALAQQTLKAFYNQYAGQMPSLRLLYNIRFNFQIHTKLGKNILLNGMSQSQNILTLRPTPIHQH